LRKVKLRVILPYILVLGWILSFSIHKRIAMEGVTTLVFVIGHAGAALIATRTAEKSSNKWLGHTCEFALFMGLISVFLVRLL
jgi:hypothetical protein